MKTRLSLFILLNLSLYAVVTHAGEKIDESVDVDENEVIDIEIINGDITITGWNRKRVQITGELSDQAEGYEFTSRNGITHFEEEYEDRRRFFGRNCDNWFNCRGDFDRAELDISVPKNGTVRLEGINVELTIKDIEGNTEIDIVNGPIEAENLSGRVNLETVNGSIDARNLNGRISLSTVNGRIRDRGSDGNRVSYNAVNGSIYSNTLSERVDAESVSGTVDLELAYIDDLEVSSVSGSIDISLNLLEGGEIEISSVSGGTTLRVNPDISARFDINTAVGGNIDNDLSDHKPVRENRFVNSSELQFSLNGGAGNVDISTVTGNIQLEGK